MLSNSLRFLKKFGANRFVLLESDKKPKNNEGSTGPDILFYLPELIRKNPSGPVGSFQL